MLRSMPHAKRFSIREVFSFLNQHKKHILLFLVVGCILDGFINIKTGYRATPQIFLFSFPGMLHNFQDTFSQFSTMGSTQAIYETLVHGPMFFLRKFAIIPHYFFLMKLNILLQVFLVLLIHLILFSLATTLITLFTCRMYGRKSLTSFSFRSLIKLFLTACGLNAGLYILLAGGIIVGFFLLINPFISFLWAIFSFFLMIFYTTYTAFTLFITYEHHLSLKQSISHSYLLMKDNVIKWFLSKAIVFTFGAMLIYIVKGCLKLITVGFVGTTANISVSLLLFSALFAYPIYKQLEHLKRIV